MENIVKDIAVYAAGTDKELATVKDHWLPQKLIYAELAAAFAGCITLATTDNPAWLALAVPTVADAFVRNERSKAHEERLPTYQSAGIIGALRQWYRSTFDS